MTTLNDILTEIQMDFNFTTTLPPATSEEYARFVALVNRYERQWARYKNYKWKELYTASSLTTTGGVSTVDLPSGFADTGLVLTVDGCIKIDSNYYRFVRPDEVAGLSSSEHIVWITGDNVKGFTLHIQPTPDKAMTITFNYFTTNLAYASDATTEKAVMTALTDYTKCPDPLWISDMALYSLNKGEADNASSAADYLMRAREKMNTMMGNENALNFNQSQEIPFMADEQGFPSLGN